MPMMVIRCPKTGKPTPTGIAIDKGSFENPTNVFTNNSVRCGHCGDMHVWDKKDAVLADR